MYSITEHVIHLMSQKHESLWEIAKTHYFLAVIGVILFFSLYAIIIQPIFMLIFSVSLISMVGGGILSSIVNIFVAFFDGRQYSYWTRYIQDLEQTFYHVNDIMWAAIILISVTFSLISNKKQKKVTK